MSIIAGLWRVVIRLLSFSLLTSDVTGAELDCLAEHAPAYARLLDDAGVSVGLRVWRGTFHAFMTFQPQTAIAEAARQDHLRALSEVM